jgi:MFS family permease
MGTPPQVIPECERGAGDSPGTGTRYFQLLASNRSFRRVWMSQLISEIGDWFYSLAVYDLLLQLTGSARAVSWAIILQTLPWFLMTPFAGPIVDRFSRKRLMILADVVRAVVVLGLIVVHLRTQVWLVYVLLVIEVIFASIFEPSRNALLPDVCSKEDLLTANAISSTTWSLALAIGAALGGAVTALAGRKFAFGVNSASFLVSALLLLGVRAKESHLCGPAQDGHGLQSGFSSLREGVRYLARDHKVMVLAIAKTGLGLLAGSLLVLAVLGEKLFAAPGKGAMAVGWLYAARGVGAGTGSLVAAWLTRGRNHRLWKAINVGYFVVGIAYLCLSSAPNLALACLAVTAAHCGGSTVWVSSTTLLQLNAEERFRGRVFALDAGTVMLAAAVSNFVLGLCLDSWGFAPRQTAMLLGAVMLVPGVLWLPAQAHWGRAAPSAM